MSQRIHQLETALGTTTSTVERIDLLQKLAWEYAHHDLPHASITQQARDLLDTLNDPHREAIYLVLLAFQDYATADFAPAIEKINHALVTLHEKGDNEWLWRTKILLLALYILVDEYVLAWELAEEALRSARKVNALAGVGLAFVAMGILCTRSGDYATALNYLQQGSELAEAETDYYLQHIVWKNRITTYQLMNRQDDAFHAAHESIKFAARLDSHLPQSQCLLTLSNLYAQKHEYAEALKTATHALEWLPKHSQYERTKIHIQMAEIYCQMQYWDMALALLDRALHDAETMQTKQLLFQCHKNLADLYKQRRNFEEALRHFEQFHEIRASVYNEDNAKHLKVLEIIHRTTQLQAEAVQERQLREQERQHYEQLTKVKDDFIASTTHDLKSPLNAIRLYLFMLEQRVGQDNKALDFIKRLGTSTDKMQTLITDLLDLAQLETGYSLKSELVPAVSFVDQAVQEHKIVALNRNISLTFSSNLRDITAIFDPAQIRRVLDNLLSNAIKYTPYGGKIEVSVERTRNPDSIIFRVVDSGPGIPGEAIPHLFERFYRVERDVQSEVEGTGLGLSIAKTIVEKHGGNIWVASEETKGSTFSFSIPLKPLSRSAS